MNLKIKIVFFALFSAFFINADGQLIKDSLQFFHINKQFELQKSLASARKDKLFSVFDQNLTSDENMALKFLFAYMPLSDLADYNGQFFLDNVRMSLKAKSDMPWGKLLPEDVFLHFVLPVRVNNENLDSFRMVMYNEIKSRISGMNIKQAVLEINHWCHEKVTYKASDERTSSPLSSIRYSFGRCGEESTFAVSAMRTAGIPARQVYTPRWAHSDDNHAWVEVWVDGKWYFLGACEPEPGLNMGWFAVPALRTMLVHTRAFGWYNGNEQVVTREENFSELNLISNYAPSKKLTVRVVDESSASVDSAKVEYQLYNYSEFFPIAKNYTDSNGFTSIDMGLGDIIMWANRKNEFGFKKVSLATTDTCIIKIAGSIPNGKSFDYDLIPPVEREPVKVSDAGRKENDRRLQQEDSVRAHYMSSFKDSLWAAGFAKEMKMNADSTVQYIIKSYGNWKEIISFIQQTIPANRSYALSLLSVISEKDLRDTKAAVLTSYLNNALKYLPGYKDHYDIWAKYVLNGRVSGEMMATAKDLYNPDIISAEKEDKPESNPEGLKKMISEKITINNASNALSRAPLTPAGAFNLKAADSKSRDILFVAMCRAYGYAARLQPETRIPQYWKDNNWMDVIFDSVQTRKTEKAFVHFINKSAAEPKYYLNFTLALLQDGVYRTLEFEEEKTLPSFGPSVEVPAGNYMLVTGSRMPDGSVLSHVEFFEIKAGEKKDVEIIIREKKQEEKSWTKINLDEFNATVYKSSKTQTLAELAGNLPFVAIFIDPDKEPTKHVMADLQPVKNLFDKWGGTVLFILQPGKANAVFNPGLYPDLPSRCIFVVDNNGKFLKQIETLKNKTIADDLPVIVSGDKDGNLFYFSKGYKIGVGEQLVKSLK